MGFACLNEAGDRLLHKIIPEPRLLSVQRTYIRSTGSPAEPLLETEEDRSFLRALEEMKGSAPPEYDKEPSVCFQLADDGDLICSGCVYRTERLTRCARYLSKPGSVLYGGPCPQFAGNA
ncbi:hypothetical protein SDC9_109133 [bioreactor metagenome]|uniref:Uncharacterized protein n=1 Tax=bioreactor metagenome TaxID=1076179 RepID=A0A645BA38_9ZZZZ